MNRSRQRNRGGREMRTQGRKSFAGLIASVAIAGVLFAAYTARAFQTTTDGCIQDVWKNVGGNSQNLTCTANDVGVAEASNICVLIDPTLPPSPSNCRVDATTGLPVCTQGTTFTFNADFTVVLT